MLDFGIQTQQGYLRMRHVSDMYTVKDKSNKWDRYVPTTAVCVCLNPNVRMLHALYAQCYSYRGGDRRSSMVFSAWWGLCVCALFYLLFICIYHFLILILAEWYYLLVQAPGGSGESVRLQTQVEWGWENASLELKQSRCFFLQVVLIMQWAQVYDHVWQEQEKVYIAIIVVEDRRYIEVVLAAS